MKKTISLLVAFGLAVTISAQTDWRDIARSGDVDALAKALRAQGSDFTVDAKLIDTFCNQPDMIQAILDFIYEKPQLAAVQPPAMVTNTPAAPPVAGVDVPQPVAGAGNDLAAALLLYRSLTAAQNLGDGPQAIKQQIDARDRLTRFLMNPHIQLAKDRPGDLPEWLTSLMDQGDAARASGFPTLAFDTGRDLSFSGSDQARGVMVYVSLFMVKQTPEDSEDFDLVQDLLVDEPSLPMTYDPESGDFAQELIARPYATLVQLNKILNDREPTQLFPGSWGMRIRHTDGFGRLRSDYTHYFQAEAGKAYIMDIGWKRMSGGVRKLEFTLQ